MVDNKKRKIGMREKPIYVLESTVDSEAIRKVASVCDTGWIGLGGVTVEFEREFARYVGAKFAVGLNSATAGLHLALVCSKIQPGDRVITTPMTFVSTNSSILYMRATPVFIDIVPRTFNIDVDKIEKELEKDEQIGTTNNRIKAIMLVHYAGNPKVFFVCD